ncbi:MAG TPA: gas vesicle protein GvpJ [Gaiellaceae bacterium]|jgi:hypothetical protein
MSGSRARAPLSTAQLDLAEILDRTLGTGVVVEGDVTLSLAGVELVYLNLRALLASVATLEARGIPFGPGGSGHVGAFDGKPMHRERPAHRPEAPRPQRAFGAMTLEGAGAQPARVDTPPGDREDQLQQGLGRLVLTVVELLRKLMERQAMRRVEAGLLEPERVERLGLALDRLERQMDELREQFGAGDDDLTLRIGPFPAGDLDIEGP